MSRRAIQSRPMGHGRPRQVFGPVSPTPMSGLESAQRKRYLRCLEAEQEQAEIAT